MQLIKFFRKLCTVSEISTLSKKRLWHRYFHVSFTKFLRTPFLQNTSRRLLLERNIMIPGTKFNSFQSLVRKFTETINSSRSAKKLVLRGYFLFFCPTRVTMEGVTYYIYSCTRTYSMKKRVPFCKKLLFLTSTPL